MSELIECKTCLKQISSAASICPHCGEEYSKKKKAKKKSFGVVTKILIILTIFLVGKEFLDDGKNTTVSPSRSKLDDKSFVRASSHLWTGVKLYYGPDRNYVFEVVGGNDNYKSSSGETMRGLFVKYPSGMLEWKDRNYIIKGDNYWVKENDPALKEERWAVIDSNILKN